MKILTDILTARKHGIHSVSTLLILHALTEGSATASTLAKHIKTSNANITTITTRLYNKDLITRRNGACDRRLIFFDLTPQGIQIIQEIFP